MNPKNISAFILLVLLALLVLTFFSQTLDIKAGQEEEGFSLGFTDLKYPKFESFMNSGDAVENKVVIDSIVENIAPIIEEVSEEVGKIAIQNKHVLDTVRYDQGEISRITY